MADNLQSAMFEILKRIQTDVATVKTDVASLKSDVTTLKSDVEGITARMGRFEDFAKRQRRDSAGMLVMMRATVSVYDQRMADVEADVLELQDDVRLIKERG
jgi:hypothetical protein